MASFTTFKDWLKRNSSPVTAIKNAIPTDSGTIPSGGAPGPNPLTTQLPTVNPLETLQPLPYADGNGGYNTGVNNTYNGGGGTGGTYDAEAQQKAQEDAQKSSLFEQIKSRYSTMKSVYDGLFKSIDDIVGEKKGTLDKQQNQTLDDLSKQYMQADGQTRSIYGARGLSDSSYIGDALNQNNQIYNRSFDDVGSQYNQKLGQLGQFASGQKGALTNQLNNTQQYIDSLGQNIGDLSVADLTGADQTLGQQVNSAQSSASNYMTNPQLLAELNKVTPINNAGTAQLASRLQALVTSSAPIFAKRQIAQGLVSASGLQDENAKGYWQSEFEKMLKSAGQA